MANNEYLKILKQGIEAWNKWRQENPEIKPDLSWADLSNMSLGGGDFREANLGWANLGGADISWTFLNKADLTKANLAKADLTEANLSEATLYRADLTGANLYRVYLSQGNLESANLRETNLREANLSKANLRHAHLRQANLSGASLVEADLEGAYLDETILDGADLSRANLYGTERVNVDLNKAKLAKTNFKYANPFRRKRIVSLLAIVLILAFLGIIYFLWGKFHGNLVIIVPKEGPSYVYLGGEHLKPTLEKDGNDYYYVTNHLTGESVLKVYSTQLKDIDSVEFVRHKLYQKTIHITNNPNSPPHKVEFDTLYSLKFIANGLYPGINPEGTSIIYLKPENGEAGHRKLKSLYIYDLLQAQEIKVPINTGPFSKWDFDWDIDRVFLLDGDKNAYLSAFRFSEDNTYLFRVSPDSGKLVAVPIETGKKWFSFIPLPEMKGFLYENKIYSLNGKYIKDFLPVPPYEDRVYYGGENGAVFLQEETLPGQKLPLLHAFYVNLENFEKRMLFPLLDSKIPCLSASDDARRVLVCAYSGMTLEFFTNIQLWSNDVFVNLVNPLLDGDRAYKDGRRFHKTEAAIDRAGRKIVFEYESKIYLIDIHRNVTFEDLVAANLEEKKG